MKHELTVTGIDLRPANPPLAVPHATASGMVATFPMVAIDLHTSAGWCATAMSGRARRPASASNGTTRRYRVTR